MPESDYEYWTPKVEKCSLGRQFKYIRRKKTSLCFNRASFDSLSELIHCECREDDWKCADGFSRTNPVGLCMESENYSEPPLVCEDKYVANKGFIK